MDQILNEKYIAHDALEDSKFLKTHGNSLENDVDVHCIICKFNLQYILCFSSENPVRKKLMSLHPHFRGKCILNKRPKGLNGHLSI